MISPLFVSLLVEVRTAKSRWMAQAKSGKSQGVSSSSFGKGKSAKKWILAGLVLIGSLERSRGEVSGH
jgi:hypothetical protein